MTTLLVVDDSAMDRALAGGLLGRHDDWTVTYATDGETALASVEENLPDLVLTDLQMPKMDGLQLVRRIRRDFPLVPVILMTAKGSEEIAVRALQQGAASYVPKRQLHDDLIETVERVLTAAGEQRSFSRLMNRMQRTECAFVLENDVTLIHSVVGFLQQSLATLRIGDETDRLRVGVALEEALVNAYYHGNLEISSKLREEDHQAYYELARQRSLEDPYRGRRIHVEARMTADEACYVIRDEGPGFDPMQLPDPTHPANLDRPHGRGLLLMRTFMDEVRFNDRGNEVLLRKRRRVETDDDVLDETEEPS